MFSSFNKCTINGNLSININTKRDRAEIMEVFDSSISSAEVKRSREINYFLGGGEKEWIPKQEVHAEDINITQALKSFRKQSITKADKNNDINCLRILSLSHIFPLNEFDARKCISKYFNKNIYKALKLLARNRKPTIDRAPDMAAVYCKNIIDRGEDECDGDGKETQDKEEDKDEMMRMIRDLVKRQKQYNASAADKSEDAFIQKYLMPAIERVLLKGSGNDLYYAMSDKSENTGKKPALMMGTKVKAKEVNFFFVERKRPGVSSRYQPESDYTKLLKQMKVSVDDQLCLGIKNPASLGLLLEGFKGTLFQMKLLAEGIYLPIAVERFSLVEEIYELVHLPRMVEALYHVKLELKKFVDESIVLLLCLK
ncbi:hypothetical protein BDB01DRAFT_844005 [Pilobolus umbonatus]|nr:hypothetical protein BDB01DRAFT_844005 [Pilobolus umbonatus]